MTDDGLAGKLAKYRAQIIEAENSPEYWKAAYELLTAHTEAQAAEIAEDRAAIRDANALNYGESAYFAWRDKHATALARAAVRDEGT